MSVRNFEDKRWSAARQKPEFRHLTAAQLIQQDPVLDVGCGDGLLLGMLTEKGLQCEGVDLSDVAVEHCRAVGLVAKQNDFTVDPLPYSANSFRTVVALDVLEHLYDPQRLVEEMKRVSSGALIVAVPNFSSLPARLQTLWGRVPENNRPNKGHVYWFNWHVLESLLKKNNLPIVEMRYNAPWERVPGIGKAMRLLARAYPNLFALSFVVHCRRS